MARGLALELYRWQRATDNDTLAPLTIFGTAGSAYSAEGSYSAIPFDSDATNLAAVLRCEQSASATAARTAVLTPIVKTKGGDYFSLTPTTVTTTLFYATGKYQSTVATWDLRGLHRENAYEGLAVASIQIKLTALSGFSASATILAGTYY